MKKSKAAGTGTKRKGGKGGKKTKKARTAAGGNLDGKPLRKTRWEEPSTSTAEQPQSSEKEKEPVVRIENLLDKKEEIVNHLFLTITVAELQELIPDYLKKRSIEELKEMCLSEIQSMSAETILDIISGKEPPPLEVPKTSEEKDSTAAESNLEDVTKKQEDKKDAPAEIDVEIEEIAQTPVEETTPTPEREESPDDDLQDDVLPVQAEVARELRVSEGDAELLELEMRARVIRALLRARAAGEDDPAGEQEKD